MSAALNFQEFHRLLTEASRTAFASVQQQHPDETFYAFSLFHEPLWENIIPVSNTEEGLMRAAQTYKLDKHNLGYAQRGLEELAQVLRWHPGDWAYNDFHLADFAPVNDWLLQHEISECCDDDEAKWEQVSTQIMAICRRVLKSLDAEGLFGTGARRTRVTLNIMLADQDRSWLEHARLLNPPEVYERWIAELKAIDYV